MRTGTGRTMVTSIAVVMAAVVMAGCGSDPDDSVPISGGVTTTELTTTSVTTTSLPTGPQPSSEDTVSPNGTDGGTDGAPPAGSTSTVFPAGDIDDALQPYIDLALTDLSSRLGVSEAQITVSSAVLVVWPDGAMGCPEKGMVYTQALVDGSVIELVTGGRVYRYHSGDSTRPFLCERSLTLTPTRVDGG